MEMFIDCFFHCVIVQQQPVACGLLETNVATFKNVLKHVFLADSSGFESNNFWAQNHDSFIPEKSLRSMTRHFFVLMK